VSISAISYPKHTGVTQQISASTTTAKATNAVGSLTKLVWVLNGSTAGQAYIAFGLTGGAATAANGFPLQFGEGAYLPIRPGEFVHALLTTGTGTVHVAEMTY
jgi:hypothetical protein